MQQCLIVTRKVKDNPVVLLQKEVDEIIVCSANSIENVSNTYIFCTETIMRYLGEATMPVMFSKPKATSPHFKSVIPQSPENMVQTFCNLVEVRPQLDLNVTPLYCHLFDLCIVLVISATDISFIA